MKHIINWDHVKRILFEGEGQAVWVVYVNGGHTEANAKDIEVVGTGSQRVNEWLKHVAGSAEEKTDGD